jgi:hypothetical protein
MTESDLSRHSNARSLALAHAIVEGIERLNSISDCFTILINKERLELSFVEVLFLSPSIHRQFQHDSSFHEFEINGSKIEIETFRILHEMISGELISISATELQSLISLCDVLENWRLKRLFVSFLFDISKSKSESMIFDFSAKKALNLSKIASELYSYSIEELSLFDAEILCEILSDEQIVVENEDSLFEVIVGLGSDYYCLFDYLRF